MQLALVLYMLYNAAAALTSVPAGRLAATGGSLAILALCFLAAGIGIGCAETAEHAAVARLAPENIRGSAFGMLAAFTSQAAR